MHAVKNCFIRGSVVRYVQLPADRVDTQLLQDASRKEAAAQSRKARLHDVEPIKNVMNELRWED
ncbi:Surfeit locus protein 1 [Parelaphostrongylus tenuis]|uniref:Surfeit locus protein 1 n=1 Tax=Parelaphostrongylus tenuis TaxID=148309 RepID=A0AAD5MKR8_PARTN|nr:Surfeit locus protein 1 [Parelaphostrongylus tenuis]